MMKQLERYIAKHIFNATLIVATVLLGVLFVLTLLNELRNIGNGTYDVMDAVFYVAMRLPGLLYQFSSILILLGSIVGLSVLSLHREMVAMQVSGFSMRYIIYSTLVTAFLLSLAISMFGEWLAPQLNRVAEINKENSRHGHEVFLTSNGVWLHVDNHFIHAASVINAHALESVTRYDFDHYHHLKVAYHAKRLIDEKGVWRMHDVDQTIFHTNRAVSAHFDVLKWEVPWNVSWLSREERSLDEMSLRELAVVSDDLKQSGLASNNYQYAFWERLFQPFATLMMVLLAIPCLFGFLRTMPLGMRVVLGAMAGIVFFILNALFSQICVVYQVPPLLSALLPLVIVMIAGVSLFSFSRT